ncbi:MAG: ABC transporter permease [Spirochaetales bacterium]|nr:ABC transporter permease [Spirochaetales bacterium]
MSSLSHSRNRLTQFREKGLKYLLAPAALVILYVFFGIFGRNFFSYPMLVNIIDAAYYIGFISIGVTFVIITGGIDLSVGTVMMAGAIIGGTAYKTWGWPMGISLALIIVVCIAFGLFNGLMVSRLKMPPFIVTLGTMMISMGVGSIVSNVRSATFPTRSGEDGWYKDFFKFISEDGATIPTGAILLLAVALISHIILNKTKMGRYIYAIGSNKEAARLSGVNVARWEMMAYVVAGTYAGIGGISYAAIYTTVLPAAGQGFELYAIAGAVIGGTSLAGGVGSVFGTLIGVFIMSVLSVGLPAMDLQAHYQTFFTGIVVIGAVLLDMYRNRKASEVRVLTPADEYRERTADEIAELRRELASHKASGETARVSEVTTRIRTLTAEMKTTYARMKAEERAKQARIRAEEREAERAFHEMLREHSHREADGT